MIPEPFKGNASIAAFSFVRYYTELSTLLMLWALYNLFTQLKICLEVCPWYKTTVIWNKMHDYQQMTRFVSTEWLAHVP